MSFLLENHHPYEVLRLGMIIKTLYKNLCRKYFTTSCNWRLVFFNDSQRGCRTKRAKRMNSLIASTNAKHSLYKWLPLNATPKSHKPNLFVSPSISCWSFHSWTILLPSLSWSTQQFQIYEQLKLFENDLIKMCVPKQSVSNITLSFLKTNKSFVWTFILFIAKQ